MATKDQTQEPKPKTPPKGMVDGSDDLLLDMERSGPDPDEVVFRINADGTMDEFPASELSK